MALIQHIVFADGRPIPLDGTLVELADKPAPLVWGYCVHRCGWAYGPRYDTSTPSDLCDLISSHNGCPGPRM
jgi:hypothetical protein